MSKQRSEPSVRYSTIETDRFDIFCKATNNYIIKLYLTKKDGFRFRYDNNKNNNSDFNFKNVRQWQKRQMNKL